jgi:mRNA interferase RelE/StbE
MYSIRFLDGAEKDLESLGHAERRNIVARIDWLAVNAERIKHKALTGELRSLYKFRVGDYRILYEINKVEKQIIVYAVGHRREIYRKR